MNFKLSGAGAELPADLAHGFADTKPPAEPPPPPQHLSEDEIADGSAAIEAALPAIDDVPVITRGDPLVFESR